MTRAGAGAAIARKEATHLDALANHVDELSHRQVLQRKGRSQRVSERIPTLLRVCVQREREWQVKTTHRRHQILLLVDCRNVGAVCFLADHLLRGEEASAGMA
jgi:hypothetical protein